jgi:hypothetical protein
MDILSNIAFENTAPHGISPLSSQFQQAIFEHRIIHAVDRCADEEQCYSLSARNPQFWKLHIAE